MGELKIIWSKQAQESVKSIYHYYKDKSLQGAKNVKRDILQSPKNIRYSKQYHYGNQMGCLKLTYYDREGALEKNSLFIEKGLEKNARSATHGLE